MKAALDSSADANALTRGEQRNMLEAVNWTEAGLQEESFWRYVRDQVYSAPGVQCPVDSFTILLTGSRAIGSHTPESDVDIDVICPHSVYQSAHESAIASGVIPPGSSFYVPTPRTGWERYFGADKGRPHFSVTSLEDVERQFHHYEDVPLWIWTHARVARDPHGQFQRIVESFRGYPAETLVRKIKYRAVLAWYWDVDVFPWHDPSGDRLLAAASAVLNSINEFLRLFFLVEGAPFPYTEQLWTQSATTCLGRRFASLFTRAVNLVTGTGQPETSAWDRIKAAHTMLCCSDLSEECRELDDAVDKAMLAAGVEPQWVAAGYSGAIDELLQGTLGPPP